MKEHRINKTVSFDALKLKRLKQALASAPGDSHATFTFDGDAYVKGYAKYLIEYLEGQGLGAK